MMKNIFIYPNLRKDSARDILQPVCDQLRRDGVRLMLPKQMRVVPPIIEDADYMKTEDAVQFADMAVVLGGRRNHAPSGERGGAESAAAARHQCRSRRLYDRTGTG